VNREARGTGGYPRIGWGTWGLAAAALLIVWTLVTTACGDDPRGAAAAERGAGRTGASAGAIGNGPDGASGARDAGGRGAPGGGPRGGPGGRRMPAITLAASDVAGVGRSLIEESVPISGDLRPLETVIVRARLEGDLQGVYVREGQAVGAGQLLAQFEASEEESNRASALADREAAQSELANAQWNLEQNAELFKAGAIAEQQLKASQQAATAARARLAAADARVRATTSTVRDTRVIAPTAGVIEKRYVQPGEHLARGANMFTLVRSTVLELAAAVPARQANLVRVGQIAHFTADGRRFDGQVARVSPTIDPSTRSATVYIQIPNSANILRGGTFASGRVVTRTLPNVLTVPAAAIRQSPSGGRPFVYRIAGRTIDVAQVTVGAADEDRGLVQVLEGLNVGDRVVVGNVGTLGRGMQVIIAGEESRGPRGGSRS
jgi:membrane fusion protein (multidrug efflux system)